MNSDEIVSRVIAALEDLQAEYLLVGSLSCNQYALPRSTHDADFVVQHKPGILAELMQRLGPSFHLDSQLQFEALTGTTRNVIWVDESEFCIELFRLTEDDHDQERVRRKVRGVFFDQKVWIPTAEDVIVWKLRWAQHRKKDWEDIRQVISVQASKLNWTYTRAWAEKHGTLELLNEIVDSIPPDLLADEDESH